MADRYQIKGKVGRGGIGAIYMAYDNVLKRDVAIKRLLPLEETNLNESAENTLTREAEALSRLQHPNVITLFAFEEDEEGPFVVMEYIEGDTIKDTIDNGALSFEDFQIVASQCLDPLITAQDLGLLHRDIKPANIMLQWLASGKFQVKILDFGLAKFSQTPSLQTLDQTGSFLGSIEYLAPEQLELKPLDQRTDLYSLGCVFYYCLAQRAPFEGANPAVTTTNHLNHVVSHISEVREDIPRPVADWLMLLISRQPDDRPKDAREALQMFKTAQAGQTPQIAAATSPAFAIPVSAPVAVAVGLPAVSGPVAITPPSASGQTESPPPAVSKPVNTDVPEISGPVAAPSSVTGHTPVVAHAIPVDAPVPPPGFTTKRLITEAQSATPGSTTKRLITEAHTATPGSITKRLITEAQTAPPGSTTKKLVTGPAPTADPQSMNVPPDSSAQAKKLSKIPISLADDQLATSGRNGGSAGKPKKYSPMTWVVLVLFIIVVGLLAYFIVNRNKGNDRYRYGSSDSPPSEDPSPNIAGLVLSTDMDNPIEIRVRC